MLEALEPLVNGSQLDARSLGELILDAKRILDAAERMEEALIDIAAIVMLPLDDGTKLERVRHRVAQGLNRS